MCRILLLAVFSVSVERTAMTTTASFSEPKSLTLNSNIYAYNQSSPSNMLSNDTDLNTTTQTTVHVSRGNKPKPLVSTETKDLVVEVVNCGLLPVVCLFGIIGNIMSLVVLYIQGSQERTNIILVGLAVSDTVFLILTTLRKINCLVSKFDKNLGFDLNMMMQTHVFMLCILFGRLTSAMTMLISIERFIAVYFPLKAHVLLTPTRIKFAVGILYLLTCSAMAPMLAMYKISYIYSRSQQRFIPYPDLTQFYLNNYKFLDFYLNHILNVAFRYVPIALVCIFTTLIIRRIKKSKSWRCQTTRISDRNSDKVTNMLLLVSCIFIVCLMPGTVSITLRYCIEQFNFFGTYSNIFNLVGAIVVLLEALNSSVNFIVYMVMSKKFAATYKRVFLCRRRVYEYPDNSATQNTNISTVSSTSTTSL